MDLKDVVEMVKMLGVKIDALSDRVLRLEERHVHQDKWEQRAWAFAMVAAAAVTSAVVAKLTKG